jgi:endonuclease-3
MQATFSFGQSGDLRTIKNRLRAYFGREPDGFRVSAVNQFIRSFIGSYDWQSQKAFTRLLNRYSSPEMLADAPVGDIEAMLEGITHAGRKAQELKDALLHIRARAGSVDLEFLSDLDAETALVWLEQIRGVGRKIAAATLNFSVLKKRAFVADTHVIRILERFGFVKPRSDARAVYDAVMPSATGLDADDLWELHWHLKRLGQNICRPFQSACSSCPLSDACLKRMDDPSRRSGRAA